MISASGRVSSALRALHVGVHSATAPSLIRQSRVAENSTLALNAARRIHEANVMARPVGAGLSTPDLYRVGVWSTRSYRPSGIGLVSCRALSGSPGGDKDKVKYEGEPMFLSLPGGTEAHTIKVNKERRLIVGLEGTMQLLSKEIGKEVPGVVSTLNDNGLPEVRWSPAQEEAVLSYLKAHEFSAVDDAYTYEGAFASGVKKVKVLSLFSLIFTSLGGPLLVIGEGAATTMQWGMAGAVVFFGASTTGLLHLITSPYVLSLRRLADGSFEAVKPVITGGERISRFRAEDIVSSGMPFETFKAKGVDSKVQGYYIHKELFLGDEGQEMLCALLGVQAAEDMYEKQLAENPNDLDTLYNYGRFLWKVQKDLPAAEGAFVRVLEEDANDDDAKLALVELGRDMAAAAAAKK